MYPLGVLFGLGFDTSSEVAVLGIASIQGAKGTSIWLILIFPLLFTGMLTRRIFFAGILPKKRFKQWACVLLIQSTGPS